MDLNVFSDLALSYEEKAFLELDKLKDELLLDELKAGDPEKWDRHRIYRHNNFIEVDLRTTKRCENLLKYTLHRLGQRIDENMANIAKENGSIINTPSSLRCGMSQPSSVISNGSLFEPEIQPGNSLHVVDRRYRGNYSYDKRGVLHLKSKKHIKFSAIKTRQPIMLFIIAKALKLIGTNNYMTQRELYYKSLDFCKVKRINSNSRQSQTQNSATQQSQQNLGSQTNKENIIRYDTSNLENALNDICCLVGCSKVHLHILPQNKGIVYGNLKLKLKNGTIVDCLSKKQGVSLPNSTVPVVNIESDAKFVLVLEKDSVMQKILDQEDKSNFISKFKVIIITGKGYPDWNTRTFINFLWSKLNIPILALTDADPHGVEIVCAYKFGSFSTAYDGLNLVTPQIKWLGLLPSDVSKLDDIVKKKIQKQSDNDLSKLNSLLSRPYIKSRPDWAEQLMLLRTTGTKAEIECLEGDFLLNTYLPNKLKYASWL